MSQFYLIANNATWMRNVLVTKRVRAVMFLAHLFRDKEFLEYIISIRRTHLQDASIILDNGAYEGDMVADEELHRFNKAIEPTTLVLPDLPGQPGTRSFARSMAYAQEYGPGPAKYLMICPQGVGRNDVLECVRSIVCACDPSKYVLGLGLAYKQWARENEPGDLDTEMTRARMLQSVYRVPNVLQMPIHLLGARQDPMPLGLYKNVIGVDSFKPAKAALRLISNMPHITHTDALPLPFELLASHVRKFCDARMLQSPFVTP